MSGDHNIVKPQTSDTEAVMALLAQTGYFRDDEIEIAREVFEDALNENDEQGYHSFVLRDENDRPLGWICFGPTPCTIGTFDIYWIAVSKGCQNQGLGSKLINFASDQIKAMNGRLMVIETSGTEKYSSTRYFYEKNNFRTAAVIDDFYQVGDAKVIYVKTI